MKSFQKIISILIIFPLSLVNAKELPKKIQEFKLAKPNDDFLLELAENYPNKVRIDENSGKVLIDSDLINELKNAGVVEFQNAKSGQDCGICR